MPYKKDIQMTDTTPTPPAPKSKPFYTKPRFILGAIAAVIFLILMFQNWDKSTIEIFFWEASLPRSVIYTAFAVLGFIVGGLASRLKVARNKSK
jgi:uncharacterized integral membrane protein